MVISSLGVPSTLAFRTRAIVTFDVDDEGVVELADVLHRLDHPTDLVVGIGNVGGEYLGLAGE